MDGLQFGLCLLQRLGHSVQIAVCLCESLGGVIHICVDLGQPLLVSGTLKLEHRDPLDQSFGLGGVCALKMPGVRGAYIPLTLCHLDCAEVEAGPEQLTF